MKIHKNFRAWGFFLLCTLVSNLAADWQPYKARYSIYRNGKLIGKADITLAQDDHGWKILSEGNGTHGLARILHARNTEYAQGNMLDGRFIPKKFSHHTRVAGIDDGWTADFDWQNSVVNITSGKKVLPLEIQDQSLDALSLKLEIQRRLRDNDPDMTLYLVDEDEVSEQTYRVLPDEQLETSLGCLHTTPVERVHQGSGRFTKAWHAPGLDYVTVRMEHGKFDGNKLEMRITELVLDNKQVIPVQACTAQQNSQAIP